MNLVFVVSLLTLLMVPLWFIWHKVYKDGLFGRLSLCGISLGASVFLLSMFADGYDYEVLPETVFLTTSFAVFLVWHLARFEYRVIRNKKAENGEPGSDRRRLLT